MDPAPASFRSFLATVILSGTPLALVAQDKWPVDIEQEGHFYQVFEPQVESLSGDRFTARAAVAVQRPGDRAPLFGVLRGVGTLMIDRGDRLGLLTRFEVSEVRFPGITDEAGLERIGRHISEGLPNATEPISIEWLTASMETEAPSATGLSNDPPEIIYTETPSALLFIDGDATYRILQESSADDPVYVAGGRTPVERVVNTPYMVLRPQGGDHYLYGSGLWFRSASIDGPWRQTTEVPDGLIPIVESADKTAALKRTDASPIVPSIVVRHHPAELLDFDGPPRMEPVKDSDLLFATNTGRDVFMDIRSQQYYFLAGGRWFSTRDPRTGPWTFVPSDRLPSAFASIPEGTKKDAVLAHVSGTDAARKAALDASIPQTAEVDRHTATTTVTYQGDPEFRAIEGTAVAYAVNASTTVLRINGRYHVCENAVWFESDTPDGPWTVSTEVPTEVNAIPPSSAVYHTRYVYIYGSTPDVVYTGYTPGYLGCYVQNGCVVFGTGYYYPIWGTFWYPRPATWGFNMFYDPWYGWGFGYGWGWNWYSPWYWGRWGGWGWGASCNGWGWWGACHHAPVCHGPRQGHHYGPRPSWQGDQSSVSSGGRERPVQVAHDLYAVNDRPGVKPSVVTRPAIASSTAQAERFHGKERPSTFDRFTDARGDVFRTDRTGTVSRSGGTWSKEDRPRDVTAARDPVVSPPTGRDVGQRPARNEPGHRPKDHVDRDKWPHTTRDHTDRFDRTREKRWTNTPNVAPPRPAPQVGRSHEQRMERQRGRTDQRSGGSGTLRQHRSQPSVTPSPSRGSAPAPGSGAGTRGGSRGGGSKRR